MKRLLIDPKQAKPPTRDHPQAHEVSNALPSAKEIKVHPSKSGGEDASIFFVGTATTIMYGHFAELLQLRLIQALENGRGCA